MKEIRTKRGLSGTLMIAAILGTGCNTEQSVPELYVDGNIRETPVTAFTENTEVSKTIKERCKAVLNQDGNANVAVYNDSADYYAMEGLSYRELLLKRLASGNADDLYTIHAEDVLEFDEKGHIYDMSSLEFTGNLSHDTLSQSTYNGEIFSVPLSYTGFGFIRNVDMLKQYGLKLLGDLDKFLDVCETLKENGILPYGANKDFALTVPVMCAGLYDVYQSDDCNQKLEASSNGTVVISEYMEKGFDFLRMVIDKGYMNPERALDTLPKKEEEKSSFANGNCAFICAICNGKALEGYPFEIAMAPIPVLKNGSICVMGVDQRMAINPKSKHLDSAIATVEVLGQAETFDSLARSQGRISSSKNVTAPDTPQTGSFIACITEDRQIPNQDFSLNFNVWENVRDLSQQLCRGESAARVAAEYGSIQMKEISKYEN